MIPRYEKKFYIHNVDISLVELLVKKSNYFFKKSFPDRFVNNIYFDTINLKYFYDNIEGNPSREKYRVRWYDNLVGKVKYPKLEVKIKKGELGYKDTYDLDNYEFCEKNSFDKVMNIINKTSIGEKFLLYNLRPTLVNRYLRRYYESIDIKFRITVDSNLQYYSPSFFTTPNKNSWSMSNEVILEIKYDPENSDAAQAISNTFPFRLTKSSKYIMGLERLHNL
jgi:hypothetical protein